MKTFLVLFAASVLLLSQTAAAGLLTFSSIDNGWVTTSGQHIPTNTNTITGDYTDGSNSFYRFDVSALTGKTVTSIDVNFRSNGSYFGDGNTNIIFWDSSNNNPPTHVDLESGVSYGTHNVVDVSGTSMDAFSSTFNSLAFSDIVSDTIFTFGVSLGAGETGTIWSSSDGIAAASLDVTFTEGTAPAPATLALIGLGLAGLGWKRRKQH